MKELIHEIHRRSLWQVLGIYLAASWVVLQVVEVVTSTVGLPDWTPAMAFVLLLIGLPICMGTAFVQEGMPGSKRNGEESDDASGAAAADARGRDGQGDAPGATQAASPRRLASAVEFSTIGPMGSLLTWRNAIMGGIGAFALLGFSLVAYFVLWTTGIGPQGSLVAQGVFEEGELVVLADFEDGTGAGLGDVTTDAIRVDLQESTVINVASPAFVNSVLTRMGRTGGEPFHGSVARELAQREGLKAFIQGEVSAVGSGYLLTASLVAAETGEVLRAFRVPVASEADLLTGIDKLSQDIREKAGESLGSIKAGKPLEEATTTSLEALRLLSRADQLRDTGEPLEAVPLLERAIEIDPQFAMAWRALGVIMWNTGLDGRRMVEAATRAWELRERLTDREASLAEAWYRFAVLGDYEGAVSVYDRLLDRYPDDETALNNIAVHRQQLGRDAEALPYLERAASLPTVSDNSLGNLVSALWNTGQSEAAWAALARQEERVPEGQALRNRHWLSGAEARWDDAIEAAEYEISAKPGDASVQVFTRHDMAAYYLGLGRYGEAMDLLRDARRIALERGAVGPYLGSAAVLEFWARYLLVGPDDAAGALDEMLAGIDPEEITLANSQSLLLAALVLGERGDLARSVFARWSEANPVERRGTLYRQIENGLRQWEAMAVGDLEEADRRLRIDREEINTCGEYCPFRALEASFAEGLEDAERAIELYEAALARRPLWWAAAEQPWTPVALERLGALHAEQGDTASARARLQELVRRFEGGDGPYRDFVARARASLAELADGDR